MNNHAVDYTHLSTNEKALRRLPMCSNPLPEQIDDCARYLLEIDVASKVAATIREETRTTARAEIRSEISNSIMVLRFGARALTKEGAATADALRFADACDCLLGYVLGKTRQGVLDNGTRRSTARVVTLLAKGAANSVNAEVRGALEEYGLSLCQDPTYPDHYAWIDAFAAADAADARS